MKTLVVKSIGGDYATLVDEGGEEILVAMALLPSDVDIGSRLSYQDAEFQLIRE